MTPQSKAEELLEDLQTEFERLLSAKNSWGKNELLLVFEKAKVAALLKRLS